MGNTIRREPVNFNIPDSPNYKFLNITNFRGLDVSSNPFELATNTASDCLNVYVDETNTLTTRPRLEQKIAAPIDGKHIGTHKLHNGYLLHYNVNIRDEETDEITGNKLAIYLLQDGKLNTTSVTGQIPSEISQCFEQGDDIYLLGDNRYMVISNNILSDVEGYVPVTSVVRLDGTSQEVETMNLLSRKFVTKYYWDGLSALPEQGEHTISVKNNYYSEHNFDHNFVPLQSYSDYSAIGYDYNNSDLMLVNFNPSETTQYTSLNFTKKSNMVFMKTQKGFWYYSGSTLYRCIIENNAIKTQTYSAEGTITSIQTSPNGVHAIIYASGTPYLVTLGDSLTGRIITPPRPTNNVGILYTHTLSDNYIYWLGKDSTKIYIYTALITSSLTFVQFDYFDYMDIGGLMVTSDDSLLMMYTYRSKYTTPITFVSYEFLSPETRRQQTTIFPVGTNIQLTEDKIIMGDTHTTTQQDMTLYFPNYNNLSQYQILQVGDHYFENTESVEYYSNIIKNKYIIVFNRNWDVMKSKYFIYDDSKEPLLEYVKAISETHPNFSEWDAKRKLLLESTLHTRFNNNHWMASGNRYYRTQYNDPTYFPFTEYNDLGDSNEDITGFNVMGDTTLLAYKPSGVYLIQPFTSSLDTTEYTITESKNTVGNTAIGAPIVTTLTEIPIQINNDGIYGLSQVANVSAVERIADLMSEPINDRWLNEDDTVIKKAMTLNRLYWTYIILPYTKDNKTDPRDVTKIYLLDNRTNSWYYWELPIVTTNAFVKDNRAEFVDVNGDVFYLTTTDIINKSFDTQLVTEYYDYGKVLIPWLWQSQVLYLGTMNYAKRLVNTTFILTDTDTQDGYGLQYSFKVFRKLASAVPEKELSGDLTLVRSTTKKTNISKFGFLQIKLSNITEDSQGTEAEKAYRNNKLRLVGLGLKYVLLEGLIR